MEEENENMTALQYIKQYDSEELLNNEKIHNILEDNFKRNFTSDCRYIIESMKQKYIDLYNYSGLFEKDIYNSNWERLMDIIYDNVTKNYDLGIIYNDPEFFIDILENKHLK